MSKNSIDQQIADRVDAFVADLTDLIRQSAVEAVRETLEGSAPARRALRAPRASAAAAPARSPRPAKRGGGRIRRTAADLDELCKTILDYLGSNPASGVEQIAAGTGIPSAELKRPIVQLLENKSIKKKGQRRGTKYSLR